MTIRAITAALSPLARRLYYTPIPTPDATRLITQTLADTLSELGHDVTLEPRTPGGRLDLLSVGPDGRALAVEIDRADKQWSVRKLARCAEEFWTDALWIRWRGRVRIEVPETVCLIDMCTPRTRIRHAHALCTQQPPARHAQTHGRRDRDPSHA
ncbi:MAG: hypothetical protein Tsb0013_05000 [Phycisphaerales bacterium]